MYDLARMFLHCLNYWKLETPTSRKQTMSVEELATYKVILDYTILFEQRDLKTVFKFSELQSTPDIRKMPMSGHI
jgi:hypothetical protein